MQSNLVIDYELVEYQVTSGEGQYRVPMLTRG